MKRIDFNTEDFDELKISELKRIADYWLRQSLLYISKRNGLNYVLCPLKNKYYPEDRMQASHFIDRSCMELRYDLDNVHLISSNSNMWDAKVPVEGYKSKHHKEYEEYLGEEKVENLLHRSKKITIFARQDYIDVIKRFRDICQ